MATDDDRTSEDSAQDTKDEAGKEAGTDTAGETKDDSGDGDRKMTDKVEVTDEHKEKAAEMAKAYQDDRPTVALPGTGHTVTGQAVVEWVDEDGSPKHGDIDEDKAISREDVVARTTDDDNKPVEGSDSGGGEESDRDISEELEADKEAAAHAEKDSENDGDAENKGDDDADEADEEKDAAEADKADKADADEKADKHS